MSMSEIKAICNHCGDFGTVYEVSKYYLCSEHKTLKQYQPKSVKKPRRIKQASDKRKVENKEYSILRKEYLLENTKCFIEGCKRIADTIEHTAGRSGDMLNNQKYWKPCCLKHNLELETNTELSKKYQLSRIHKGKK